MSRYDRHTRPERARHHKHMNSGRKGKGSDAKLRRIKRDRGGKK